MKQSILLLQLLSIQQEGMLARHNNNVLLAYKLKKKIFRTPEAAQ